MMIQFMLCYFIGMDNGVPNLSIDQSCKIFCDFWLNFFFIFIFDEGRVSNRCGLYVVVQCYFHCVDHVRIISKWSL